jgi:hypothetical protein
MRLRKAIGRDDEAGIGRLREPGDGRFDVGDAVDGRGAVPPRRAMNSRRLMQVL